MPERPTSVTVLCVITAILGCLGLGCIPISVFMTLNNTESPTYFIIEQSAFYRIWMVVGGVLGVIATFVALAGVGGSWTLRPWGRMLMLGYAVYSIVMGILGTIVNFIFLVMPIMNEMDMSSEMGPPMLGGAIGGTCGGLCGAMLLPGFILYFFTRPHVVAAFDASAAAG